MQITIPDVVRFSVARLETGIDCDLTQATDAQAAAMVIFNYGLRRWVNDKTGGDNLTDEQRMEKAQDAIDALLSGETRTRAGGPRLAPWTPIFRKTLAAFLVANKIVSKAAAADKIASGDRAAALQLICQVKPEWDPNKVQARLEKMESDAREAASAASDDDDLI